MPKTDTATAEKPKAKAKAEKAKAETKAEKKPARTLKASFNPLNPCRDFGRAGRPSERKFIVDELMNAKGVQFKACHERAADRWAKEAIAQGVKGTQEELAAEYAANIPSTKSNTVLILKDIMLPALEKRGVKASYTLTDKGEVTFSAKK